MKRNKYYDINRIKPLVCTTILVILFTIVFPMVIMSSGNNSEAKEIVNENKSNTTEENTNKEVNINGKSTISVYITLEDRIEEVDLEDYVCGVVANEMPVSFDIEALKAQAIASRTYAISKKLKNCSNAKGADICDSVHCQVYSSKEKVISKWTEAKAEEYWNKIKEAVDSTKGKVLTYEGELALYPQFFSTSSGKTENAIDVSGIDIPYLKSVESLGEEIAPKFTDEKDIAVQEFVSTVNSKYPNSGLSLDNVKDSISVVSRSNAGGIIELKVGNQKIKGSEFRFLIGLNSTNFDYSINDNIISFYSKGYGHGIGMSQWGANVMGKEGSNYEEILKHYYTGVNISDLKFNE